ncbi:hypothetical protein BC834DRAFT_160093 [Gloeopeniophorella convolvens]|nr:hypothetical protein BC834DRAFT_160093 [Gloeopeniophorella convolvens]
MTKAVQKFTQNLSLELDAQALSWAFRSLDEDHELEEFLAGIPGFLISDEVKTPDDVLTTLKGAHLGNAVMSLMDRSWSSDLITSPMKQRRIAICLKIISADRQLLLHAFEWTLLRSAESDILTCIDFIQLASSCAGDPDRDPKLGCYAKCVLAVTISRLREYDDRWSCIAKRHLGLSDARFDKYRAHGDSLQLRNLLHIIQSGILPPLVSSSVSNSILAQVCKFDATNTFPGLQHEFCALWNRLLTQARQQGLPPPPEMFILLHIRAVYAALHKITAFPPTVISAFSHHDDVALRGALSLYPLCTDPSHHLPDRLGMPTHSSSSLANAATSGSRTLPAARRGSDDRTAVGHQLTPPKARQRMFGSKRKTL